MQMHQYQQATWRVSRWLLAEYFPQVAHGALHRGVMADSKDTAGSAAGTWDAASGRRPTVEHSCPAFMADNFELSERGNCGCSASCLALTRKTSGSAERWEKIRLRP